MRKHAKETTCTRYLTFDSFNNVCTRVNLDVTFINILNTLT